MTAPKVQWSISLGNVLTVLALGVAMLASYFGTQAATAQNAVAIETLAERQAEDRAAIRANASEISQMRRTEGRVDERLRAIEQSIARTEATTTEILRYLRQGGDQP